MFHRKISFNEIPSYQLCCGCGVCAYLYPAEIEMRDAPQYGRRPFFLNGETGKSYEKALDACPGISLSHNQDYLSDPAYSKELGKTWGPVLEVWEGHAADQDIRYRGSSGGVITALALYSLQEKKAVGVLHVKADPEVPYLNKAVISSDRQSLVEGAGSRYSPASPCEKLMDVERSSGKHVIIGKPCDIAATQKVRKVSAQLDSKIALTIACFCAGTPSTQGTIELLSNMGVSNVLDIRSLRYRGFGWPGKTKVAAKSEENERHYQELSYEESWGSVLQKYRQWRCYICPDHTGEFADISIGDPWYRDIEEGEAGSSLIIARSNKGREFIQGAMNAGYFQARRKDDSKLPLSQPNLKYTRARLWGQLSALQMLRAPCPYYSGFFLMANWQHTLTIREKAKSIMGTLRRAHMKKLSEKHKIF